MKWKSVFLLFICLLCISFPVHAKSSLAELDELADEALKLTKFSKLEEAKLSLERFGELFSEQGIMEYQFTMDELRILTAAHHNALNAVTSVSLNQDERIRQVTSFRLATDAVMSKYQPLWVGMEGSVLNSFRAVKNAALQGDAVLYNQQLNDFLAVYSVIQPSIKIDVSVEKVQMLDSKVAFIDNSRTAFSEEAWLQELDSFEVDLQKLFTDFDEDDTDPSIWWVIIMTGSIIVSTLSYVSWRKYRGQKVQKKRRDLDD
ncbi:sporulation protein YpjB [Lederbergia graminis]|uniref:Sporulation protein YpjB n=1 Tax=Lederbergia graminis TaxID=735518 RepID=A0ABW0LBQ6_9BACI